MTEPARTQRFDDRAGYLSAVQSLIAGMDSGLDVFDADLRATGLDSRASVALLTTALARSPRAALRIVLHEAGPLQVQMPRLWSLCSAQGHRIRIRQTPRSLRHLSEMFMLNGSDAAVIRTHRDHWRGKLVDGDSALVAGYLGRFDEIWDACSCCISTTTLGL